MVLDLLAQFDTWLGRTLDGLGVVGQTLRLVVRFTVVLAVFGVWSAIATAVARRTFLGPRRMEPTLGGFASRLLQVTILSGGIVTGIAVMGVDLFAMATSLGLVGLGLAFGMQNTIANVVAGISMAVDRPFTVGDRIKIGDHWGEVEEIGLRSVRILTARREYVVIPNRVLDEQEIWNYTIKHPELRVDISIGISYESDLPLAEQIATSVAEEHPLVLSFPRPRFLVSEFGDHGIEAELWVYVRNARDRYAAQSEVLRRIKHRFDEEGVEIPYMRQVNIEYDDLPDRGQAAEEKAPVETLEQATALVISAGEAPARQKAKTVVRIAEDLGARLIALHVVDRLTEPAQQAAEYSVRPFLEEARRMGVEAEPLVLEGTLEDVVGQVVQSEHVDVVIVGATGRVFEKWSHSGVQDRLKRRLGTPVITVDQDLAVDEDAMEQARALLRDRYGAS